MAKDRVLVEIITAANMAGVKEAQAGFLGLHASTLALGAVLGGLVMAGKSAIEIAEKHDAAQRGLSQAYIEAGTKLSAYQGYIDTFIESNKQYTDDQSAVIDGFAQLTRSGLNQTEVQKDMNRALDLASLKHISLSDAVNLVDNAEHGRLRGLIDLGITSAKYVDSAGNVIDANHNMAKVMDELDTKTKHGRDTLTEIQQESYTLSNDWQDLANKAGPPLIGMLDAILGKIDDGYTALDKFGKDNAAWAGISYHLTLIAQGIHDSMLVPLQAVWDYYTTGNLPKSSPIRKPPGTVGGKSGASGTQAPGGGYVFNKAASGYDGMVSRPTIFLAGEAGAEHVKITPSGQGGNGNTYHFHFSGFVGDNRAVTLAIRDQLRRLDREQR